jgi:hypothetical protein
MSHLIVAKPRNFSRRTTQLRLSSSALTCSQ